MTLASEASKALRGTKRVCQACAVRFYDLSRDPIVCPSCGAEFAPGAPVANTEARAPAYTSKTTWRGKGTKRPDRPAPAEIPEHINSPDMTATDDLPATEELDETEAASGPAPEDDIVLEPEEGDDADVTGLVEHDIEEPKER